MERKTEFVAVSADGAVVVPLGPTRGTADAWVVERNAADYNPELTPFTVQLRITTVTMGEPGSPDLAMEDVISELVGAWQDHTASGGGEPREIIITCYSCNCVAISINDSPELDDPCYETTK